MIAWIPDDDLRWWIRNGYWVNVRQQGWEKLLPDWISRGSNMCMTKSTEYETRIQGNNYKIEWGRPAMINKVNSSPGFLSRFGFLISQSHIWTRFHLSCSSIVHQNLHPYPFNCFLMSAITHILCNRMQQRLFKSGFIQWIYTPSVPWSIR